MFNMLMLHDSKENLCCVSGKFERNGGSTQCLQLWRQLENGFRFFFISRNMTRMNYGTISFLIILCDYASVKDNQTRKSVRAVILGDSKLQLKAFENTCHVFR
jgi:hypothetical protein